MPPMIGGNSVDAIIPIKRRPSDDVVPLKCRYTNSGICANIAGFCLCRQANTGPLHPQRIPARGGHPPAARGKLLDAGAEGARIKAGAVG
jgi:hypothetical protein